jgi:integral membrane protein (TIGR01906 family)
MMRRRSKHSTKDPNFAIDIVIGILFALFLISLGLILAINMRFLYYADIKWFNLEDSSGLSYQTIKENYNALIDYCSPFYQGNLVFPTLAASASGISHFAEVKVIFNTFYLMFTVTTIALTVFVIIKHKKGQYRFFFVSSITAIVLPLITLAACAIDFNTTFRIFHLIVFRNDDWMFDPTTDPIITLLPEIYFLQCALIIVAIVLLGSLILYLIYRHQKKKNQPIALIPRKVNYYY